MSLLVGGILSLGGQRAAQAAGIASAVEAHEAVRAGTGLLIDIRHDAERRTHGVPKGALWIEWPDEEGSPQDAFASAVARSVQAAGLARAYLICANGHRSGRAVRLIERKRAIDAFDVAEGFSGGVLGPGWREWGLPVVALDR